jgi:hypothetical protein
MKTLKVTQSQIHSKFIFCLVLVLLLVAAGAVYRHEKPVKVKSDTVAGKQIIKSEYVPPIEAQQNVMPVAGQTEVARVEIIGHRLQVNDADEIRRSPLIPALTPSAAIDGVICCVTQCLSTSLQTNYHCRKSTK